MMQVPMKHALSKAYEEWKTSGGIAENEASVVIPSVRESSPDQATSENDTHPNACSWLLGISIVAITLVDIIEAFYFDSAFTDALEISLFLSSFLIIMRHMYLNRIKIYRNLDVLIDSSKEGLARKNLMFRLSQVSLVLISGQCWGYSCAFMH
jgi:hypothetical protein